MHNIDTTFGKNWILRTLEKELYLQTDTLKGDEDLKLFQTWDSLAILMFILELDKNDIKIQPTEIALAENIQDIINIICANSRDKSTPVYYKLDG